jgi:tripartite-type tricarboxylate transporter receptor subunit TctC
MGGGVQLIMANVPVVLPQVQAGKLHALGVTSKTRAPELPQVPAVAESVPGFEVISWGGIVGPAKLPQEVVTRLNAEIRKALANPAVAAKFKALGAEPMASTPEEFRDFAHAESVKWAQVIKTSGAKVD